MIPNIRDPLSVLSDVFNSVYDSWDSLSEERREEITTYVLPILCTFGAVYVSYKSGLLSFDQRERPIRTTTITTTTTTTTTYPTTKTTPSPSAYSGPGEASPPFWLGTELKVAIADDSQKQGSAPSTITTTTTTTTHTTTTTTTNPSAYSGTGEAPPQWVDTEPKVALPDRSQVETKNFGSGFKNILTTTTYSTTTTTTSPLANSKPLEPSPQLVGTELKVALPVHFELRGSGSGQAGSPPSVLNETAVTRSGEPTEVELEQAAQEILKDEDLRKQVCRNFEIVFSMVNLGISELKGKKITELDPEKIVARISLMKDQILSVALQNKADLKKHIPTPQFFRAFFKHVVTHHLEEFTRGVQPFPKAQDISEEKHKAFLKECGQAVDSMFMFTNDSGRKILKAWKEKFQEDANFSAKYSEYLNDRAQDLAQQKTANFNPNYETDFQKYLQKYLLSFSSKTVQDLEPYEGLPQPDSIKNMKQHGYSFSEVFTYMLKIIANNDTHLSDFISL